MKRLRYDRVLIVFCLLSTLMCFLILLTLKKGECVYKGKIETYIGCFEQDNKLYTFDLKGFTHHKKTYLSLNDMYNVFVIMDRNMLFSHSQKEHNLTLTNGKKKYVFDYLNQTIVYNNKCVYLNDYNDNIYINNKNYYLNIDFIEKIILNNEKKIEFDNKNAIIR